MGMKLDGISEAQGSADLMVSAGVYVLELTNARLMEVERDGVHVANRLNLEYTIIDAPDEAKVIDSETQELAVTQFSLPGKALTQSIYMMKPEHPSYNKAHKIGENEAKDVVVAFEVPFDEDDEVEWPAGYGRQAEVYIKPSFREGTDGRVFANNEYRRWKALS